MNSDSHEDKSAPRKELKTATSMNSLQPVSQRDLDALESVGQMPTSIPSLQSGLISPKVVASDDANHAVAATLANQKTVHTPKEAAE
jgi:hypothetical protein